MTTSDDPSDEGPPRSPDQTSLFPHDRIDALDGPDEGNTFEPATDGVDVLEADSALLVVQRGPNAGSRFLLNKDTTSVGRHPHNDICLDDVTVSRQHAQFRRESGEFGVVDLGSLNGTYLNSEPVDTALLAHGDKIRIGESQLVFLTGLGISDAD